MAKLVAYLHFNGNCREAMNFYKECLGGELWIQSIGESPAAAHMPAEAHNNILHSQLETDSLRLMAADLMGGESGTHGSRISLCLIGDSKAELETLFAKLSQGGTVNNPLKDEFFGTYGDLTDKFGYTWMFQFGAEQNP